MHEPAPGTHVTGGGGTRLHVIDAGNPRGRPIVFVHGFCQSTYAWRKQFASDLGRDFRLVAFDMRGHGRSDKPGSAEAYADSRLWADDVSAVVNALDLRGAILVAWSYGGYVVGDYLRHHGTHRIGAVALVAAATLMGGQKSRGLIGPRFAELFPDLFSAEVDVLRPAMARFVALCVADPLVLPPHEYAELLMTGELVPAVAREAMNRRKIDNDDVLQTLTCPTSCIHGTLDAVVTPLSSEHSAGVIPGATLSFYEKVGHSPFVEAPDRFNRELRELAAKI